MMYVVMLLHLGTHTREPWNYVMGRRHGIGASQDAAGRGQT